MNKFFKRLFSIFLIVTIIFTCNISQKTAFAEELYYLGGNLCGFDLTSEGVTVIGLCDVITKDKIVSPAKDAGIKTGDLITKVNNNVINSDSNINDYLTAELSLIEIVRNGNVKTFVLYPALDISGEYKLGVFIRKGISGIGTISFIKNDGSFCALGHEVLNENCDPVNVIGGKVYECGINNILKGKRGSAGELQGYLKRTQQLGILEKSKISGIYGKFDNFNNDNYKKIEIADKNDVSIGTAYAYSLVSGKEELYKISIVKIDNSTDNKNFVIKIEDDKLLELTGGIVQGMSGTPIIQNNKLVGAITHVFINDPTRGYGINIQNML